MTDGACYAALVLLLLVLCAAWIAVARRRGGP